ncbi:hypothetical protein ACT691_03605 [Vibrio metschnikovii]
MKNKPEIKEFATKSLLWHKKQAAKSELFSENIAKELGLTSSDLRMLSKQKKSTLVPLKLPIIRCRERVVILTSLDF